MFGCRCACWDPLLLSVNVPGGGFAMKRYQFDPICHGQPINIESTNYEPEWTGTATNPGGSPLFYCDTPTTLRVVMTATGIGVGEVELTIFDGDDDLVARYLNDVVWQPHCYTQFRLVEYAPTCGEVWKQYPCLGPVGEGCGGACVCNGSRLMMSVTWDMNGWEGDFTGVLESPMTLECGDQIFLGIQNCHWVFDVMYTGLCGTETVRATCEVDYNPGANALLVTLRVAHFLCSDLSTQTSFSQYTSVIGVGPEGTWCDGAPWEISTIVPALPDPIPGPIATVTPVPIPETTRPEIRFDCTPRPQAADCNGESLWTLKAYTLGANYLFYWDLVSDTCDGANCNTPFTCNPGPPFDVPTFLIDAAEAERLEILDEIDSQLPGACGCIEAYVPPDEPNYCHGNSTWTLGRTHCPDSGPGAYIYGWVIDSTTCAGLCSDPRTCNAVPPFQLSPFPLTDGQAEALGYDDILDVPGQVGSCGCEEAYTAPECPVCDCDSVDGPKLFTISGTGTPTYDGNWTLNKGLGGCPGDPGECCFGGTNEEAISGAVLTWSGGVWTLVIAGAVYELTAGVCDDPLVMTQVSDPTGILPGTITVTE